MSKAIYSPVRPQSIGETLPENISDYDPTKEQRAKTLDFLRRVPAGSIITLRNFEEQQYHQDQGINAQIALNEMLWAAEKKLVGVSHYKLLGLDIDNGNEGIEQMRVHKIAMVPASLTGENTLKDKLSHPVTITRQYLFHRTFLKILRRHTSDTLLSIDSLIEAMRLSTCYCNAGDEYHLAQLEQMMVESVAWAVKHGYLKQTCEMLGKDWRSRHAQRVFETGFSITEETLSPYSIVAALDEKLDDPYPFSYSEGEEFRDVVTAAK